MHVASIAGVVGGKQMDFLGLTVFPTYNYYLYMYIIVLSSLFNSWDYLTSVVIQYVTNSLMTTR